MCPYFALAIVQNIGLLIIIVILNTEYASSASSISPRAKEAFPAPSHEDALGFASHAWRKTDLDNFAK